MPNYKFSNNLWLFFFFSFYPHAKNLADWPNGFWDMADMNAAIWLAKSNYTKAKLKFYNPSSRFLNLYLQAKTEVYLSTFNWNLVDSKILQSDWPSAFSMKRRKNFTNHLLGFLNLHLHAKNEVNSLILTWII